MGGFYSFRVFAPHEVMIPENFVALDEGMNTFNCHVNDIDTFVARLRGEDVRIDQMHHLDAPATDAAADDVGAVAIAEGRRRLLSE